MKNAIKTVATMFVTALLLTQSAIAADESGSRAKQPPIEHQKVEQSKVVKRLLAMAEETNDAVYYMAAAKMIDSIAPVAITKKPMTKKGKVSDNDIWTASELFGKVVKIAGAKSDLGKQASALATEMKKKTNAEGCWGYRHYHVIWYYDAWGNYVYYYEWHNC